MVCVIIPEPEHGTSNPNVTTKMIDAQDATYLYELLTRHDIPVWLTGGWGIDALLGEETRPHKDLDVILLRQDITRLFVLLEEHGYHMHELWSENRWVQDPQGNRIPTAFVLADLGGRQLDVHAMDLDPHGNGIPAWTEADDFIFTARELAGQGTIAGTAVNCITPECQVKCHSGYPLPESQRQDLAHLQEQFGVEIPSVDASGKPGSETPPE